MEIVGAEGSEPGVVVFEEEPEPPPQEIMKSVEARAVSFAMWNSADRENRTKTILTIELD